MNAALALVERQSLVRQRLRRGLADSPQVAAVISKDQEVIAVPDVLATAKPIHHDVVDAVKKHIGKELAGEVSDGNAPSACGYGEEVIARIPLLYWFLGIAGINDSVQNGKHRFVGHDAPKLTLENLVVNAGEELLHISLEHKAAAGHEH